MACQRSYGKKRDLRRHIRLKHPEQLQDEAQLQKERKKYFIHRC